MKKFILTVLMVIIMSSASFAVPNLQLYIPDATFDTSTDTWVHTMIGGGSFEVWVLVANLSPTDYINDIHLTAALAQGVLPESGSLTITPIAAFSDGTGDVATTYTGSDFVSGTPPEDKPIGPHGIYPANYIDHLVTLKTQTPILPDTLDSIFDMPTGGGPSDGLIYKFDVTTTFDYVHFDVYGYDKKREFAPFSHDAETVVPEPATMLLFGLGLAGAGVVRRFRK